MNNATSDTTGFSPCFLNYGRTPAPLLWTPKSKYPGMRTFAENMKNAIMTAHDEIIAARVKQTRQANRDRRPAPFEQGDLVYLSTKNLRLPKNRARKLTPKYIGPFRILKEIEKGASYKLDLPDELRRRGVSPSFHPALLRIHVPNNDTCFPGRQLKQIPGVREMPTEWTISEIKRHTGKGADSLFEVLWNTGE
jgi:hypothetical protein